MILTILIALGSGLAGGIAGGVLVTLASRRRNASSQPPELPPRPRCIHSDCRAFGSPDCSDGRCRHHCKDFCECETDKPPVDPLTAEAQKALGLRRP